MDNADFRAVALTVLLGAAGAATAFYLAFPAPFLIGPALFVMVAGLCGLRLIVPAVLRNACFVLVGISMGAAVTPEVLVAARRWPFSFVMVAVAVVVLLYSSAFVLERFFGFDRRTAVLAASPGHLSFVISLSADSRSDVATVAIVQSVRVMVLTLLVPPILELSGLAVPGPTDPPIAMSLPVLAAIIAVAGVVGAVFVRLRFPAALLLGGVAASALPHISGLITGQVPLWLMNPVYILLGSLIGTRFSGVSIRAMRSAFVAGGVTTLVATVLATAFAVLVSAVTGVSFNAVLIAFAPGGLETMAAMAVIMHADTTYVGSHHVLRLLLLSVLMPYALGRVTPADEEAEEQRSG